MMVATSATVEMLERGRRMQAQKVTIMLHKPLYYASCRASPGVPLARKLLTAANRWHLCPTRHDPGQLSRLQPADFLDEGTSGLLLFSQDGRVATKIDRDPDLEKEYCLKSFGE